MPLGLAGFAVDSLSLSKIQFWRGGLDTMNITQALLKPLFITPARLKQNTLPKFQPSFQIRGFGKFRLKRVMEINNDIPSVKVLVVQLGQ